jgi:predicted alpha/beta-hydrolase family hydrolase
MSGEPFAVEATQLPAVRGVLHRPAAPNGDGLVLTHGAGGNAQAPLLVKVAEAFAARGVTVLRCDLPYRQARRSGPPSPAGAPRDRDGLRHAVQVMRGLVTRRVFLGGISYGGRQASLLAAGDPGVAGALLLLSYPLHPPGRPTELRTQHFPNLQVPILFVQGTADSFGSLDELEQARTLIPARTEILVVSGGHDLGYSRPKVRDPDLGSRIATAFATLISGGTSS